MEPVEINAGAWYLRSLRDDDRVSDVHALQLLGVGAPPDYVARTDAGWADESLHTWAVCIPTTGELVALIGVRPHGDGSGDLVGVARDGFSEALDAATEPVSRFAAAALGVRTATRTPAIP